MTVRRPLLATYRLQLNHRFTLRDAIRIVPYLHALGISHIYSSPILKARPGSMHGYDVVDPCVLNPELGTDDDLSALVRTLREHGMGLVLDIVPNHMGIGSTNRYWDDVLAHGQTSRYAHWFDIDWHPPERSLAGRVLVPVLGRSLDAAIAHEEITLALVEGALRARYFDHTFPLDPATIPASLRRATEEGSSAVARYAAGRDGHRRLRTLLGRQHYVLANWRRATRDINYRRFFNIDDLVALRMEDESVFRATHERILAWVADGTLDGLRIDHIDGLLDPLAYLERLRTAVSAAHGVDDGEPFPIVVEKILSDGERLRTEWPVQGTTGYEFLNELESVFVDARGKDVIEARYRAMLHISRAIRFEDVAYRGKLHALRSSFAPDVDRVHRLLAPIAQRDPRMRELPASVVREAIVELIACFPVYRTYIDERTEVVRPEDRRVIDEAITRARTRAVAPRAVLDFLEDVLLRESTEAADADAQRHALVGSGASPALAAGAAAATVFATQRIRFIERFQQVCGPAAAKGVEDTALYRYVPLASLNEVGGEPDRPLADAVARLHAADGARHAHWPHTLLAVSTHDTKHSADVRARLDALSEIPERWMARTARWHALHRALRTRVGSRWAPDANAEYLLYQTLVGIWPTNDARARGTLPDAQALETLRWRVDAYMRKAAREAKAQTAWVEPNTPYETALSAFIQNILQPDAASPFLAELDTLVAELSCAGITNALSRAVVHFTAPGTPDCYQGDELWSFTLVDPDNRRPPDFAERESVLSDLDTRFARGDAERAALLRSLVASPSDGRLKLHVIHRALLARRAHPELFREGNYLPLHAEGSAADHVLAFARTLGGAASLTIAPRRALALSTGNGLPLGPAAWGDTALRLPPALAGARWECALTGQTIDSSGDRANSPLRLAQVFHSLPIALLVAVVGRQSSVVSKPSSGGQKRPEAVTDE